ncbi:hypothetical protein EDD22DRAFT_956893 [Suillus occidentalis]|nr:hypothetical protein EDD22DRAFT_956893 [Suillus occidentalis]
MKAEIVHWVCESTRLFDIVKDHGFVSLMKTSQPEYYIPSPSIVLRDMKMVFMCTQHWFTQTDPADSEFRKVPSLVTNKPVQSHGNSQSARERKQAAETPMWRDVNNAVSESVEESTTCGDSLDPNSKKGIVKLLDQNYETRQVVRDAILDAKGHIIFVNAYPELVDKNQVSLQSLLTVANNRGIKAIKKHLQTDVQYAVHLGSLVEPWIPLLCRDLKVAACANIDSYFHLNNNMLKAKKLMEQHMYIYALRNTFFIIFPYLHSLDNTQEQSNDDALPIGQKPYQVFDGAKSIGIKFVAHFLEITRNKANRCEVPIPLLALVATAIYATLFWKTLGSLGKFNFTGNQFSETYVFHVKLLKDLKKDAPGKFHCMMADIFEAVQTLKQKGNDHLASEHRNALSLLDLDGMADD